MPRLEASWYGPRAMWIIASWSESELGDLDRPRIVVDECPKCGRRARIIERQVVSRVKVFTMPLLTLPDGPRTFQCEKCKTCFEAPREGLPSYDDAQKMDVSQRVEDLRGQWVRARREIDRWKHRIEVAQKAGDRVLQEEARRLVARHEKDETAIRKEIERLGGTLPRTARDEPDPKQIDEELEALRQKSANRKSAANAPPEAPATPPVEEVKRADAKPAETPSPAETPPPTETPSTTPPDAVEDELSALKKKMNASNGRNAPVPAAPPPGNAANEEDELAALKRRLKGK